VRALADGAGAAALAGDGEVGGVRLRVKAKTPYLT